MLSDDYRDFEQRVAAAIGVLNAAHGQLIALVAELMEADHWRGGGVRSPEHWLTVRAGVSHATARRLVTVARRRAELPAVMGALTEGVLTLDHAHVVAQFAPAYSDHQVAGIAEHATVSQLRSLLSRYRFAEPVAPQCAVDLERAPGGTQAELSEAEDVAVAAGSMSSWHDEHGRFHLAVEAPADDGALIKQSLDHARDVLFHDPPRGAARVTSYDALLAVCARSFASGQQPRDQARRDRFGVYLHLDTSGRGWLDGGRPVPPSLLKKITCDGAVRPVWQTEGVAVSVGRAQRVAPPHTRRLVIDRDGGCRFPGCGATGHLEAAPPAALGRRRADRHDQLDRVVPAPPRRAPSRRLQCER